MPVNKNALLRFKYLDEIFRSNNRYGITFDSLKSKLESSLSDHGIKKISERTVRNDFNHMKTTYDVEIICCDGYYKYSDPEASISKSPITNEDAEKLQEAVAILKQFKGLPQFNDLEEILIKLDQKVSVRGKPKQQVVDFDKVEYLFGMEHLNTIYSSILKKNSLKIHYKPFESDESSFLFSASLLKEYNNRWFVFGNKEGERDITNLAIDRITRLQVSDAPYTADPTSMPQDYFNDIVGVTRFSNKEKIRLQLRFPIKRGMYVKSKPIHHSQIILKETSKFIIFEIAVIPNYELAATILSFGQDVEVISPASYRKEIQELLIAACKIY